MKYKVGDKVRIRKDLVVYNFYGGINFLTGMGKHKGKVLTLKRYYHNASWDMEEDQGYYWNEEMFEPAKRTLRDMEVGDIILNEDGEEAIVLAVCGDAFLLTFFDCVEQTGEWTSFVEAEKYGWKIKDQEPEEEVETVEVLGKKYRKSDIEALKEVEV